MDEEHLKNPAIEEQKDCDAEHGNGTIRSPPEIDLSMPSREPLRPIYNPENAANRNDNMDEEDLQEDAIEEEDDCDEHYDEYFDELLKSLPANWQKDASGNRPPNDIMLLKSVDYIRKLQNRNERKEEEYALLHSQVTHMQEMTQTKFQVLRAFMDELFVSFDQQPMHDIDLQSVVTQWIGEHCSQHQLRDIINRVLGDNIAPAQGQDFEKE